MLLTPVEPSRCLASKHAYEMISRGGVSLLDVRSEVEFERGSFPGAINAPILNNEDRHQVGLCYKVQGRNSAIQLGLRLVLPKKKTLLEQWKEACGEAQPIVFCWRGGLRSRFACAWMEEAGLVPWSVMGGFRALRHEVLARLAAPPPLIVLAGPTGSGKTRLLQQYSNGVDLEALAQHRGSAFGSYLNQRQPSQIDFENALAIKLTRQFGTVLVEDESRMIGKRILPEALYLAKRLAPTVVLNEVFEQRVKNVFQEYVLSPLQAGVPRLALERQLQNSLENIRRRLGGCLGQEVAKRIEVAFCRAAEFEPHAGWISLLLAHYYDPLYQRTFERHPRRVVFQGNKLQCVSFLTTVLHEGTLH